MHYEPKCNHQRRANELCISRDCKFKNCFACVQCKRMHSKKCEFMEYKKFIFQIHKKQGLVNKEFMRYEQRIQSTFNLLIKALKNEFIEFRQQFERLNAPQQIIEFYDTIKNHQEKRLTGELIAPLLDFEAPTMQQFKMRDEIQMKILQNNIFAAHSYVIKKLKPYYSLKQKFQQIEVKSPDINELREIQNKYIDRKDVKQGLLKGDLRNFQTLLGERVYNIQMLFQASSSNFSCRKFHERCDGKKNTLVMAKTEFGKVVGLWCPFTWQSPEKWVYLKDFEGSFMFSMQKQLYGLKFQPVKLDFSIGFHKDYGPIFGDDFVIYESANTSKGCWSNFPDVYNCKAKPLPHNSTIIQAFIGIKDHFQKFNLIEWEVYKISLNRAQDLEASWMKIYQQI